MRCCVQNCFNYDSKKTNKSHGITFHKLPRHPDHSAAWLAALARLGCRTNKCLVVCSEHFLPEDFDDTRPNQRRVKSGAVPTKMAPVIQEDLKVCRVCLALDVKMYNMKDFKLSEMFQDITGISVIDKVGSIRWVCWDCTARLKAAAAFREKALLSDALLKDQVHIKKSDIVILKQNYSSLKSPLSIKTAFTLYDIGCENNINKNNEIDNIFIPNDETVIKERKSQIRVKEKEIEFEEYEPWIDVPVKTEVESDPIADNNTRFQDRKSDKKFELTFNDTSPREDSEDEMTNSEVQINYYNDNILSEDTRNEVPVINDGNIIFVEDYGNVEKKPQLDGIGNIMDGSWSEEDTQISSEAVSVKSKKKMSSKAIDKVGSIQWVCWDCTARLKAAAAFREKALLSDALLKVQVHIKKTDIVILKQNYSSLKSPLSIKTAFTLYDIGCENTINKNNEIDNIFIPNEETVIKERKSQIRVKEKEIEFEEYEPWIDVPVKTEVESDPIADNNTRFQDRKSDKKFELTFNDTSPREDSEDEMTNSEVQINYYNDNILSEDTRNEVPVINDGNIIFVEDYGNVEKKPQLDGIGNIMDGSWSEEDTQISSEAVSVKSKKKMSSKVWTKKEMISNIRNNENLKGKIIALKKRGFSVSAIAKETGASIMSIHGCLLRHNYNVKNAIESDSEQNNYHNEPGKEMAPCSANVRRRLRNAGLEHILMIKPEITVNMGQKISKRKELHDDLKKRIIALKQEGVSNNRVAYLLNTTRITVRKWWNRWCNDGHMNNRKSTGNKRKTTAQEDQLLIERVAQEQTVHTPSLAKELGVSAKCVRNRLREAGFQLKERKASIPLRSGRSHKVDDITKQQIISMKHNGVSVTDIANQFRVTRTSVYYWWRRWCTENNIKITNDSTTSTTAEQEQTLAEHSYTEKIVQTPSILSSKKSLWEKLPDVEFIS